MEYAKTENGQVTQIGLSKTGILTQVGFEGCAVSEYDKLPYISENPEIPSLQAEGWLPLVDNPPAYNNTTQYLEYAGYTIGETEVVVNYNIKAIVPVVAAPTIEERLAAVEDYLMSL
jgi:hypothetical protein